MQITPEECSPISEEGELMGYAGRAETAQIQQSSPSVGRYEILIPLLTALPFEELVVPAGGELRIGLADLRTRIVHRTAPGFGIEEHADAAEGGVLAVPEDHFALDHLGVPLG